MVNDIHKRSDCDFLSGEGLELAHLKEALVGLELDKELTSSPQSGQHSEGKETLRKGIARGRRTNAQGMERG